MSVAEYDARRAHEAKRKTRRRDAQVHSLYATARAEKVDSHPCRMCTATYAIEAHHIVPRSKFGQRNPAVHDPANLMPLCHDCHQAHHTTTRRVLRDRLTPAEHSFALTWTNPTWVDHWYPTP